MMKQRKIIKICGLTTKKDIDCANAFLPDMAGFILFFPKSRRNKTIEEAAALRAALSPAVKSVAVVVSPNTEQVSRIEEAGFDYIQIHGTLDAAVYDAVSLPILRAFNVTDLDEYERAKGLSKIAGYVFDSKNPGSGTPFDWTLLDHLKRDQKMMLLAGGIDAGNVLEAIRQVNPDGVDVSSSVETEGLPGKDPEKMRRIIALVHNAE